MIMRKSKKWKKGLKNNMARTKKQTEAAKKRQAANQAKKFDAARKKTFGLGAKQPKKKVAQTPVYKSGFVNGKAINYSSPNTKRGIITSLD